MSIFRTAVCILCMSLAAVGLAQTVTVDPTATPDGVTTFTTIQAAILSFDELSGGANASDTADNVVMVRGFGPFDEGIPVIYTSDQSVGGAETRVQVSAPDSTIRVVGSTTKALILAQENFSNGGIASKGSAEYIFENVIIAPSPTDQPVRWTTVVYGDNGALSFEDSVLCCLPAGSTAYTDIGDIPAGILDGSRAFDSSYIRTATSSGIYGQATALWGGTGTRVSMTNTVVTQFGDSTSPAAVILASFPGTIEINEGCVIQNNTRGIKVDEATANLYIQGTRENRVFIGENTPYSDGFVNFNACNEGRLIECNVVGNPGNAPLVRTGAVDVTSITIQECVLAGDSSGAGFGVELESAPTANLTLDNLTVMDIRYPFFARTAMTATISNTVMTAFYRGVGGFDTVNYDYCGINGVLSLSGITINQTSCVLEDPQLTSRVYGETGFAEVNNLNYAFGASDGSHLDGGGSFGPQGTSVVYVDPAASNADNVTTFTSLQAAILSFSEQAGNVGINAMDEGQNYVYILGFGPYDEGIPVIYTNDQSVSGAETRVEVSGADSTIHVVGVGSKSLILAQDNYGNGGIVSRGSAEYIFENVIIAPSPTDQPVRWTTVAFGDNGALTFNDCVLCCLPAGSTGYTGLGDIPAGILDGSLAFDSSYIRTGEPNGIYGQATALWANTGARVSMTDTVVTQFGDEIESAGVIEGGYPGTIEINEGCVIRNNTKGIKVSDAAANLYIRGTRDNRVLIGENTPHSDGFVNLDACDEGAIVECNVIGDPDNAPLVRLGAGGVTSFTMQECILAGGGLDAGFGLELDGMATDNLFLDNLTVMAVRYPFVDRTVSTVTISNTVMTDFYFGVTGFDTVNYDHCGIDGSLAPSAVTANQIDCVLDDPQMTSQVYGEAGFAEVNNPYYAFAASDGSPLDGGGSFTDSITPTNTVYVDPAASNADNVTTFTSLQAAILSFDEGGNGINSTLPGTNTVVLMAFGPFDEGIPVIYETGTDVGGAETRVEVSGADSSIRIVGLTTKSLVLAQDNFAHGGIVAKGNAEYILENLIIAPSPTDKPNRWTAVAMGDDGTLTFQDCVLTALPADSPSYTGLGDIPSGILDGSRAFESSYSRTGDDVESGLYGQAVSTWAGSNATVNLTNTVVTQFGTSTGGAVMNISNNAGAIYINEGCIIRNNTRGIHVDDPGATLIIEGTRSNRVLIADNNGQADGWVNFNECLDGRVIECNLIGNPGSGKSKVRIGVDNVTDITLRECIMAEGSTSDGTGLEIEGAPSGTLTIEELTITNIRYAFSAPTGYSYTVQDSIISEMYRGAAGDSTLEYDHCGINGNPALSTVDLTLTDCVQEDPQFGSILFGTPGFVMVQNPNYGNAASDGANLDGGGSFKSAPRITVNTGLSLYVGSTAAITNSHLAAEDDSSAASDIVFTLTVAADHGTVLNNGVAVGVGETFTQADIDGGLVTFQQDGTEQSQDNFRFTVTDIDGQTSYGNFFIHVTGFTGAREWSLFE